MSRFLIPVGVMVALVACGGGSDKDGDGLTKAEELELGTDPDAADSDADGIADGDEAGHGTDPVNADSDGDGLGDGDELDLGLDPLDDDFDDDGWNDGAEAEAGTPSTNPYIHPFEDGDYRLGTAAAPAEGTGPTGEGRYDTTTWTAYDEGDIVDNYTFTDQFGQEVDLYAFQGRYVLLAFGAMWCPPCQDAAEEVPDLQDEYEDEVTFIEVLSQDERGNDPDEDDLTRWYEDYELERVPVLADPQSEITSNYFEKDGYIPTFVLLDPEMRIVYVDEYQPDPGSYLD